jgi:hypothetical protein
LITELLPRNNGKARQTVCFALKAVRLYNRIILGTKKMRGLGICSREVFGSVAQIAYCCIGKTEFQL